MASSGLLAEGDDHQDERLVGVLEAEQLDALVVEVDLVLREEQRRRRDEEADVGVVEVDEHRVRALVGAPAHEGEATLAREAGQPCPEVQLGDIGRHGGPFLATPFGPADLSCNWRSHRPEGAGRTS